MSYKQIIIDKLTENSIWYEEVPGSLWIKVKCMNPNHNDSRPSAGINVDSGIHHCFSCQHSFMFVDDAENSSDPDALWKAKYQNYKRQIQEEYADYDSYVETQKDRNLDLFLPPVEYPLTEEWRGLSPELLSDAGAYFCSRGKYRGRYVFPFYQDGQMYGFDARIVDASANMVGAKWIRNRGAPVKDLVYPKDILKKRFTSLSHIVVCEGVADALSYIQMGVPAIASFGMSPPSSRRIEELIRLGVEYITIAFDNDVAGVTGIMKVMPIYAEWFTIKPHPLTNMINASEYKDANEFLEGIKTNGLKTNNQGFEDDGSDF
jgi:hypothetical protein